MIKIEETKTNCLTIRASFVLNCCGDLFRFDSESLTTDALDLNSVAALKTLTMMKTHIKRVICAPTQTRPSTKVHVMSLMISRLGCTQRVYLVAFILGSKFNDTPKWVTTGSRLATPRKKKMADTKRVFLTVMIFRNLIGCSTERHRVTAR
ncbi:hypothetical protein PoB_001670300 [Plakobranchus ocellatus]|uniref:Uncharacterized protein n=1 Tax=Plakobranchus ocellatus TaxID=259542 RepID=A0AAV3Z663_9GAST|nr:hypothetical protein PoB_001670300 [Plakobranchus ocellatus]